MKSLVIQGKRGVFQVSDPRPVLNRTEGGPDRYMDTFSLDYDDDLAPGQVHPLYPGLILREAAITCDVPAVIAGDQRIPGIYYAECQWDGTTDADKPEKVLSQSETRQLRPQWESFTEQRLTWHAMPKAITGTASTDVIACPAHGLSAGRKVALVDLTGGAGLTSQSSSALATVYYVINANADDLQLSLTVGGSAVNFTTNITAGSLVPVEYLPGSAHPELPQMYLDSVQLKRGGSSGFHIVDLAYIGKRTPRPYHRITTVNGQQMTSSIPLAIGLSGGWVDERRTNFSLPQISVVDTYVTTDTPATSSVPSISTPPDAPSVPTLTFSGPTDNFIWNYPYGWSLMGAPVMDSLSSAISLTLQQKQYSYIWPMLFT